MVMVNSGVRLGSMCLSGHREYPLVLAIRLLVSVALRSCRKA